MTTLEMIRGEETRFRLRVTKNGSPQDITGLTIECEVKETAGAADPAFVTLSTGAGITAAVQSGDTLGWAYVTFTSIQSNLITAGLRYIDVCAIIGVSRKYIVKPRRILILNPVNQL